jgi:hypothetical protein
MYYVVLNVYLRLIQGCAERCIENLISPIIFVAYMSEEERKVCEVSQSDLVIYQLVVDHFKQDTREFWTRANFYLVAHAGLFSAYLVAFPAMKGGWNLVSVVIPLLGSGVAVVWFIVLRGAITFLGRWRDQVIRLDKELDRFRCYVDVEALVKKNPLSSPSYVTQFLPILFGIVWITILVASLVGF